MGKRVRLAPSRSKHKLVDKKDKSMEDWISQLPDEVLVSILSLLTFKEAARTSVLSHRWERLWIFYNGSLDFDATETLDSLTSNSLEKERSKYVSWVNQVLVSLGGGSSIHLDDFRVRFDLNIGYSCHIDRWIKFALEEKRVQRLELNLKPVLGGFTDASERYNFPLQCYDRIKQPCGLYNLTALTSLCLKFVNVSGELIEHFLSNCPLLEQLSVEGAEQLLNLKVIGPTLKLKYLEIRACLCLEIVEISAPNLVSLIYYGKSIILHVENVPQLAEVSIGGRYHHPLTPLFRCLSSHFSQLETLKLDIHNTENKDFMQYLELSKLKHLILCITVFFGQSLLDWTSLIEASPSLHKFTLELASISSSTGRKLQTGTKRPHQCLKVVELVGFVGCPTDVEFAMYLLENAMALEEIIIECKRVNESDKNAAKSRALQLKRNLPKGVNLVVI